MPTSFETSRIALLVPAHNAEAHLPALLDDIARQTLPFGEVIFFDDASSDRTAALVSAAGHTLLQAPRNIGPAAGRNRLLRATTLPWVHFHDADDRIEPAFAASFAKALQSGADAGRAVWFCAAYRENRGLNWSETTRYRDVPPQADWIDYHLRSFISHIQMVFPREILEEAGGYDERLVSGEDVNLHIRIAARGHSFRYLDEVLVRQNCGNPGSLTSTTRTLRLKQDTLLSCLALRPLLPAAYHHHMVGTVSALARHFASLDRPAEMESALAELDVIGTDPAVLEGRSGFSRLARLVGHGRACRLLRFLRKLRPIAT